MRTATMKDIALELNVSVVTVSKALAGKDGVSESTRWKVQDVARAMGYTPPGGKESPSAPQKIGIIIYHNFIYDRHGKMHPDSFYWHIHNKLSLQLSEMNCVNVLEIITPEMEKIGILPTKLQSKGLDGLIVLGQMTDTYLSVLTESGIPMVLLDFYSRSEHPYVASNNFHNAYIITSYLISEGHRDIGFVGNTKDVTTTSIQDRYWGMCKALAENNLPIREEWVLSDRVDRARVKSIEFPNNMPTAFVCNCDQAAWNTIEALQDKGFRVPDDISVVGFDDSIFARLTKPQITTMALDVDAMTARAAKSVLRAIKQPDSERESFVIQGRLVIRESVGKPSR